MKVTYEVFHMHRETVAGHTINHNNGGIHFLYIAAHPVSELIGSVAHGLYLIDRKCAAFDHLADGNIDRLAATDKHVFPFLENIDDRMLILACHLFHELDPK